MVLDVNHKNIVFLKAFPPLAPITLEVQLHAGNYNLPHSPIPHANTSNDMLSVCIIS